MTVEGRSDTRQAALRWQRDTSTPARVYQAAEFWIIWDPAGLVESEPGGWHLSRATEHLGIFSSLGRAKEHAETVR